MIRTSVCVMWLLSSTAVPSTYPWEPVLVKATRVKCIRQKSLREVMSQSLGSEERDGAQRTIAIHQQAAVPDVNRDAT